MMKIVLLLGIFAIIATSARDITRSDSESSSSSGSNSSSDEDMDGFCDDKARNANYWNPWGCNSYIQCRDDGSPIVMPCPAGLNFNPNPRPYGQCDGSPCRPPPSTTKPPTTQSTTKPPPPFSCKDLELDANYPNPGDSESYIMCRDDGTHSVMPCPEGLKFYMHPRPYGHCGW